MAAYKNNKNQGGYDNKYRDILILINQNEFNRRKKKVNWIYFAWKWFLIKIEISQNAYDYKFITALVFIFIRLRFASKVSIATSGNLL